MPDRILRAGILTSDRVNELSWGGEVFYRRLMNVVDDFGCYDGRESILRASLYPLKIDRVDNSDIAKWLAECAGAGLVRVYLVDSKPYIMIENFNQRLRANVSKWPQPADIRGQMTAGRGQMTAGRGQMTAGRGHPPPYSDADADADAESDSLKPPLPPKGETPKPAGISKSDLSDVGKIHEWLKRRGKSVGLKNDHISLTMLVAASERAIEVGDDPVGLFIALAKDGGKGDWSKISGEQHDRAKRRMRNHIPGAALAETNGVPIDD